MKKKDFPNIKHNKSAIKLTTLPPKLTPTSNNSNETKQKKRIKQN